MVGAGSPEIQWCTTAGCTTRYGDRVGCFPPELGSDVKRPPTENRWPMVSQGARDTHQLPGVVSRFSGNPSICQGEEWHQYSGQNRQHLGQGLHKSLWGNTFMANECSNCRDMEVVHRSSNLSDGRISSGNRESSDRHGVMNSQGSLQLDASSSSFFTDGVPQLVVWPLSGNSVDQEDFQKELHDYWHLHGGAKPHLPTSLSSKSGIAGVRNGVEIPLEAL